MCPEINQRGTFVKIELAFAQRVNEVTSGVVGAPADL